MLGIANSYFKKKENCQFFMIFVMQAYIEKEDSKKLKQKQRERMQPKMGKMDIDYQVFTTF